MIFVFIFCYLCISRLSLAAPFGFSLLIDPLINFFYVEAGYANGIGLLFGLL